MQIKNLPLCFFGANSNTEKTTWKKFYEDHHVSAKNKNCPLSYTHDDLRTLVDQEAEKHFNANNNISITWSNPSDAPKSEQHIDPNNEQVLWLTTRPKEPATAALEKIGCKVTLIDIGYPSSKDAALHNLVLQLFQHNKHSIGKPLTIVLNSTAAELLLPILPELLSSGLVVVHCGGGGYKIVCGLVNEFNTKYDIDHTIRVVLNSAEGIKECLLKEVGELFNDGNTIEFAGMLSKVINLPDFDSAYKKVHSDLNKNTVEKLQEFVLNSPDIAKNTVKAAQNLAAPSEIVQKQQNLAEKKIANINSTIQALAKSSPEDIKKNIIKFGTSILELTKQIRKFSEYDSQFENKYKDLDLKNIAEIVKKFINNCDSQNSATLGLTISMLKNNDVIYANNHDSIAFSCLNDLLGDLKCSFSEYLKQLEDAGVSCTGVDSSSWELL